MIPDPEKRGHAPPAAGRTGSRRARVGVLLLLLLVPQSAWAQGARFWDETALWADFIYTLRSWEKGVWVITPAFRTDEQEINSTFMTRVSTDATFAPPREWEVRGRFSLIGHGTEFDDVVFDKRIQNPFGIPWGRVSKPAVGAAGLVLRPRTGLLP